MAISIALGCSSGEPAVETEDPPAPSLIAEAEGDPNTHATTAASAAAAVDEKSDMPPADSPSPAPTNSTAEHSSVDASPATAQTPASSAPTEVTYSLRKTKRSLPCGIEGKLFCP